MLSASPRRALLTALGCLLSAPLLTGQTTPAKDPTPHSDASDQTTILIAARAKYLNLRNAGVKSFHCDVAVDWPGIFASFGQNLPEDNPMMHSLRAAKISVTDDLESGPKAEWVDPTPISPELDKAIAQMRDGLKQMIQGFFDSWNPTFNGKLITMWPRALNPAPGGGYILDDGGGNVKDLITLDKNLSVTHLSSEQPNMAFEGETLFEPSSQGLVMTSLKGDYHQPASAPVAHLNMTASFQPVGKYTLPAAVQTSIPGTLEMKMRFTGCTVQTADDEASLTPPR